MLASIKHAYRSYLHTRKDKHAVAARSPMWGSVSGKFLERNPFCSACGGTENLHVHHVKPFHVYPELELVESNFITLCMAKDRHCHLLVGHGDNFRCWVEDVVELSAEMFVAYKTGELGKVKELVKEAKEERRGG